MTWSRETKWRQGSVVEHLLFETLGISGPGEITHAIAISHDCDIANENEDSEPFIEFVLGKLVESRNGNYEFGKNPRILHIHLKRDDKPIILELQAPWKISVFKHALASVEPDQRYTIDSRQSRILQDWLSARYRRQAMPDNLNDRLRPVAGFLEEKGKKNASGIIGYWLDYDPRDTDLPIDEPYELWLYIVYSIDDPKFEEIATNIVEDLNKNFKNILSSKGVGNESVILKDCVAYSEEEFTLNDLRLNIQYRFEYLSHRIEPPGPVA